MSTQSPHVRSVPARNRAEPPPSTGAYLVMLGTRAGPFPSLRAASSTALVVDGHIYLIDAGTGLVQRFYESGLAFGDVEAMFITHLHSDHVMDYFPFFNANFANWRIGTQQIQVFGPDRADRHATAPSKTLPGSPETPVIAPSMPAPGIVEMNELLIRANAYDLNNAISTVRQTEGTVHDITGTYGDGMFAVQAIPSPESSSPLNATPSMQPIEIFADERVRVLATLVAHPPVFPAWGFRVDTPYCSVVFSGDTAPCDNLRVLCEGADILVNEVMAVEASLNHYVGTPIESSMRHQFLSAHTPHEAHQFEGARVPGVGEFASATGVRALILNHIFPHDESLDEEEMRQTIREDFGGFVHLSHDLDVVDLVSILSQEGESSDAR